MFAKPGRIDVLVRIEKSPPHLGKTTAPEFGLTATTESKATDLTRNPSNPAHIAEAIQYRSLDRAFH